MVTLQAKHSDKLKVKQRYNYPVAASPLGTLKDMLTVPFMLTVPVIRGRNLSNKEIQKEIEHNVQGFWGHIVYG